MTYIPCLFGNGYVPILPLAAQEMRSLMQHFRSGGDRVAASREIRGAHAVCVAEQE